MSVAKLLDDLGIIAALGDNPNTDNDLSAADLKAKFDEAAKIIQKYLNEKVVPALNKTLEWTEDAAHPGCYYRTVDGEQEWLNPPMEYGVAYRTQERYAGLPVYVITLRPVALVEGDNKLETPFDSDLDAVKVIGMSGFAKVDDCTVQVPFYYGETNYVNVTYDDYVEGLHIGSGNAMAYSTCELTLKYVKN